MKKIHHSQVFTEVAQVCRPNINKYTFKKRKSLGVYQIDEYEYKTVESTSSMTAWAIVGYDWQLHQIDKTL